MTVVRMLPLFALAILLTDARTAAAQAPAASDASVTSPASLDALVAGQVRADEANRQAVRDVLDRQQVRAVAGRAGLDLQRARHAVGTLSGAELQEIADHARRVDAKLAGGASVIVISTTTIIIVLLLVLLIVALD